MTGAPTRPADTAPTALLDSRRRRRSALQPSVPDNARALIDFAGCSYRQLNAWASRGLLGDDAIADGPGSRRQWTSRHAETAYAFTQLTAMGATGRVLAVAAPIVAARPVNPTGELLVVTIHGVARRFDHWCARPDELDHGVYVIPLRPYTP